MGTEGDQMNKNERHNCPYCDDEIVFKDEQGSFWAKQHGIHDCMAIIKKKKDDFRDALKKTQDQLAERDEELFVAKQKIGELNATVANITVANVGPKMPGPTWRFPPWAVRWP